MATFTYNAINAEGLAFDGTLTAADVTTALGLLRQQGLMPDRIDEVAAGAAGGRKAAGSRKAVKAKSLQIFSRQFATMIEAGAERDRRRSSSSSSRRATLCSPR